MTKDIKPLLAIYTIVALGIWIISNNISHNKEIKSYQTAINKEFEDKIEAMSIALELDKSNEEYIVMLDSTNKYVDELEYRIQTLENQSQILKELRSSK